MAALRRGRNGQMNRFGQKAEATPAIAEQGVVAVLSRRWPETADGTPKNLTQQCWAGQEGEGDYYHRVDGQAALSPHTKHQLKKEKDS